MSLNHNNSYNAELRSWIKKNMNYTKYLSSQKLLQRDCPICKSSNYKHFANNGYLNYSKCQDCSLVFMNPTIDETSVQDGFRGGGRFAYVLF